MLIIEGMHLINLHFWTYLLTFGAHARAARSEIESDPAEQNLVRRLKAGSRLPHRGQTTGGPHNLSR